MSPENCPALVLNADYRPLSYFPLSLWSWQETVKGVFLDRVNIVAQYDREVRSPSWRIRLPSVISLKRYVYSERRPAFTRFNVFLRDGFTCQYCRGHFDTQELTFDHILPKSRGGNTHWTNVITACASCNLRKGDQLLGEARMRPRHMPRVPSVYELQSVGRRYPPNYLHKSWSDFLYWDSELDSV